MDPGTKVEIHRHPTKDESFVLLRGRVRVNTYNDDGSVRESERYGFHKCEAERLKRLKARYPKSNIKKIAKLLGYREKEVEEDLFNQGYLKEKGRCFEKFTRDILGIKKC